MALTNSQYDQIMRTYEAKQRAARLRLEKKKAEKRVCKSRFEGRKGMLFCTWKMKKRKNRIDNIAGGR